MPKNTIFCLSQNMPTSAEPCKFFDEIENFVIFEIIYAQFHTHYTIIKIIRFRPCPTTTNMRNIFGVLFDFVIFHKLKASEL